MPEQKNMTDGVGQDQTTKDVVDKYDAEHGRYADNVPREPNLPNISPSGPDPSPFKVGPT
jgi:hypothetical protein